MAPGNLLGIWEGSFSGSTQDGPWSMDAELTVHSQDGDKFTGRMRVSNGAGKARTDIEIQGTRKGATIEIKEVRVVTLGAAKSWTLGSNSGALASDGRRMSGKGKQNADTYAWQFTRK
jgi:hypothetical protein